MRRSNQSQAAINHGIPEDDVGSVSPVELGRFEGQYIPGGIGDYDECEARIRAVVSRLDVLGSEVVFDRVAKIIDEYGGAPEDAESLLDSALEESSCVATSLNRDFFRARVEYHLDVGAGALDSLKQLVDAHPNVPEVLEEAARMRFLLASETARRVHLEALSEAEAESDWAEQNLWSLVETGEESEDGRAWAALGPVTFAVEKHAEPRVAYRRAVERAERRVQKAKSRLQTLRRVGNERYYRQEVRQALQWALGAQTLGSDHPSICELIAEMRRATHVDAGTSEVASDKLPGRAERSKLRRELSKYFNESELRDLCFDLDIRYEALGGEGTRDKARELIDYCERHGLYRELVDACVERRPKVSWYHNR